MQLTRPTAEVYVPDGAPLPAALERTTHLAVAAHQDDVEIMAIEGILDCFGSGDKWFAAAIVTDGAGSARDGLYARYTDEEMRAVRRVEQKKAAYVGEYGAALFLDFPSSAVKGPGDPAVRGDIAAVLAAMRPQVVYTHNLADKHATHIGVALKTLQAIRRMPREQRPRKLYGCEVWRGLDWMPDEEKVLFSIREHENVAEALVGVFDSQIVGGKRYDLATMGRRRANATYFQSHSVDQAALINFGMDLTPLIEDDSLDVAQYVTGFIDRFAADVRRNLTDLA